MERDPAIDLFVIFFIALLVYLVMGLAEDINSYTTVQRQ
jgi:hypothetical protein